MDKETKKVIKIVISNKVYKIYKEDWDYFNKTNEQSVIVGTVKIDNVKYALEVTRQRRLVYFFYFKPTPFEIAKFTPDWDENERLLSELKRY
jgi:hypothetical protein